MVVTLELNSQDIHELCRRYFLFKDKDLQLKLRVLSYKLQPTSDAPTGFLGRHLFLNVEIDMENIAGERKVEKICFFTKSAPKDISAHMDYIEEFGVFKKEILVYRDVLPLLQGIFANVAPKCFYANNDLLVFENLTQQGYRMAAGRDGLLDYAHLTCVLKTLAAQHAASIVHEVQEGRKFPELYAQAVLENAYPSGKTAEHVRQKNFNNAVLVLMEFIKIIPKYQTQLDYILEQFPRKMMHIFTAAQQSTKYQNVFSHGDLWANNIMFQYGNKGNIPIQCRFVDYQLARYAAPQLDVITVLTIPTSRQFRTRYLSELSYNYYCYVADFLKRAKLCITDFMTQQEFEAGMLEYRVCGIIESLLFSHLTVLPPELTQCITGSTDGFSDFIERKRVEICMEAFRTDHMYRERLTDMLEDFLDNFVLLQIK